MHPPYARPVGSASVLGAGLVLRGIGIAGIGLFFIAGRMRYDLDWQALARSPSPVQP